MKFEEYFISQEIKDNLEKLGFRRPTDIQYKSIPPILNSEDVLAIAQTGTGKTAAYAIPIIDKILKSRIKGRNDGIKCVVMVPTHELALQTQSLFIKLISEKKIKTLALYGGVEQDSQISALMNGVDVLIATPGRLFDLNSQGYIRLNRVNTLVLDEADHMLDLGFIKDIRDLIKILPKNRQTLFFSATIDKKIKKLAYSLVRDAIRIQISPKDPITKSVTHQVAYIGMDDKRFFLERIVNENEEKKILVFVRTKVRAERVAKAMSRVDIDTLTIHSDKDQKQRESVMSQFAQGKIKILIATDISARGVDIPNIDYVVNYDLPDKPENYVHRVGRTGRAKQKGYAISFCSKEEKEMLDDIENYINKKIQVLKIEKSEYQETIDFSMDTSETWQSLMKQANKSEFKTGKKRKK
jgi:ATP-dependent RNA helicase RhlE